MKKIDSALVIKKELENEFIKAPEDFKKRYRRNIKRI